MNEELIKKRLGQFNPNYQKFIVSGFVSEAATALNDKLKLDDIGYETLENGLLIYLLAFVNEEELTEFIEKECNLDAGVARNAVYAFMAMLPENLSTELVGVESFINEEKKSDSDTDVEKIDLDQDIAQAEADIKNIPTIHTMQDDIKSTSQEDILKNRQSNQDKAV
jgi:hypothetical protein